MIPAAAVALIGVWLVVQTVAGRLPARVLSLRAGNLGNVEDQAAGVTKILGEPTPSGDRSPGGWVWPTAAGNLTQGFRSGHDGIDIGAPSGTAVFASRGGTVVIAGWNNGGYGQLVTMDHGGGFGTYYAHLSKILVTPGQRVAAGAVIGQVGSTGRSTGPHLHFEIRQNGTPVDPAGYL